MRERSKKKKYYIQTDHQTLSNIQIKQIYIQWLVCKIHSRKKFRFKFFLHAFEENEKS